MLTESPTEAQAAKAQVIKIQVFCLINQVQAVAPTVSCLSTKEFDDIKKILQICCMALSNLRDFVGSSDTTL